MTSPGPHETQSKIGWLAGRARRRVHWARELGLFVGEDKLPPVTRIRTRIAKWRWRRTHDVAPLAVPIYVVGVQRSGTNMLVRGFGLSPEFEIHNEDDRRAFDRFRLRPTDVIRSLVERSGHAFVLFKPLCDSHRVGELLDSLGAPSRGRAIWIYRRMEGRVRSAVATFGTNNLDVLRAIAAGRAEGRWHAEGISSANIRLIRSFDYDRLSPESGAALFWNVRNSLYFDLGLSERDDVMLVSYDAFVRDPETTMRSLCGFLSYPYTPGLVAHIGRRPSRGSLSLDIDPEIRGRCRELEARLDSVAQDKAREFLPR